VENLVLYNEVKVIVGHSRGHSVVHLCRCESGLAQTVLSGQSSSPGGWFQVSFAPSQEESQKEELRGYCKTKVSEYKQVGSKGQGVASSW